MKKTNKKGFTLVELLAVIVILAVLILLALPNVIKIMNNAKKNAFQDEVLSYLKTAQTNFIESQISGSTETTFSNKIETLPKLDIEDKSGYEYCIKIFEDETGDITYNYVFSNGTYSAYSNVNNAGEDLTDVNIDSTYKAAPTALTAIYQNCN